MFEDYIPKKFCREFVEIRGGSLQLAMIMATVKGIKPCMDDWVNMQMYEKYYKVCKKYGLFVKPDMIFDIILGEVPLNVVGRERLCTTKAFGFPFNTLNKNGSVHVFISRAKDKLDDAFKNGWYPLIIKNRVIDKPLVDCFKFGHSLGYPTCCVDFFRKFNNWFKYSFVYEEFKNSMGGSHHYLCNSFLKDFTYSYIYHMPCSFSCKSTIEQTKNLRHAIFEEESEFVKKIDMHLKMPLLVFYERKFYAFIGEIKNNRLFYKNLFFIGQMPTNNLYEADLRRGNCVFVDGKDVVILKNRKLIKMIKWREKSFAPETPYIIQFN